MELNVVIRIGYREGVGVGEGKFALVMVYEFPNSYYSLLPPLPNYFRLSTSIRFITCCSHPVTQWVIHALRVLQGNWIFRLRSVVIVFD